jgi:hypothetical protein
MNLLKATLAVVASGLLALPGPATASPLPDPPPRTAADAVQVTIDQLTKAYALARLSDKRGIHNEIVLLINVGPAAL